MSLHDPLTLEVVRSLIGERGEYSRPSFSSSGYVAAAGLTLSNTGLGYVWDSATGVVVHIVGPDTPSVMGVEFIPGTDILVVGYGADLDVPGRLVAIDLDTLEEVWAIELETEPRGYWMAVSPDGTKVAVGSGRNNLVQFWDITTRKKLFELRHGSPQTLTWDSDGGWLAVSGNDADVTVIDVSGVRTPLVLTGHRASVWGIAFHPTLDRLVSASLDGSAIQWDISEVPAVGDRAVAVGGEVGQFFFGSDPDRMMVGVFGCGIRSVDVTTGTIERDLPLPDPYAFRPSERLTTVAGWIEVGLDLRGALVGANTGEATMSFPECQTPKAISPSESFVVIDAFDPQICPEGSDVPSQVLDIATDEVLIDLEDRWIFRAVFSPAGTFDGHQYVVLNVGQTDIEIYSLPDGDLVTSYSNDELATESFLTLDLDSKGRYLGFGVNGSHVVVIDVASVIEGSPKMDAVALNIEAHGGNAPQVRVTSDGIAVSGGFDGFYRVWDTETGEMLFRIREPGMVGFNGAARFTWDGSHLAYEDAHGSIRFTPVDTMEVVAQARAALTRSLTDDECRQISTPTAAWTRHL